MPPKSTDAREQAEMRFKKKEQRAAEGAKASADYEAQGKAIREKTARLRELRLAKQAAEGADTAKAAKTPAAKTRRK